MFLPKNGNRHPDLQFDGTFFNFTLSLEKDWHIILEIKTPKKVHFSERYEDIIADIITIVPDFNYCSRILILAEVGVIRRLIFFAKQSHANNIKEKKYFNMGTRRTVYLNVRISRFKTFNGQQSSDFFRKLNKRQHKHKSVYNKNKKKIRLPFQNHRSHYCMISVTVTVPTKTKEAENMFKIKKEVTKYVKCSLSYIYEGTCLNMPKYLQVFKSVIE